MAVTFLTSVTVAWLNMVISIFILFVLFTLPIIIKLGLVLHHVLHFSDGRQTIILLLLLLLLLLSLLFMLMFVFVLILIIVAIVTIFVYLLFPVDGSFAIRHLSLLLF